MAVKIVPDCDMRHPILTDARVGTAALLIGGLPGLVGGGAYSLFCASGLGEAVSAAGRRSEKSETSRMPPPR